METPPLKPPQEQVSAIKRFDNAAAQHQNFVNSSQRILEKLESDTKEYESLSFYFTKINLELEELKKNLTALQLEHQKISQRYDENDDEQKKLRLALTKLQDMTQLKPTAPEKIQRSGSHVSQMREKFSGKGKPSFPQIPRDPEREKELTDIIELNVLGNPERETADLSTNTASGDQHLGLRQLPLLQSAIESLQQQTAHMTDEISELRKKTEPEDQEGKNLNLLNMITEQLQHLDPTNLPIRLNALEETNKNRAKEIAKLKRIISFQWISGGAVFTYIVALSLWMYAHRK